MASPTELPEGRPPGSRKVPHSLTTTFFAKKKGGELRSPITQSPTMTLRGSSRQALDSPTLQAPPTATGEASMSDNRTEPIAIPAAAQNSSQKQKKLTPSNTFNTHYRSISRSMNDLGNIFTRGRSPPNRDVSPLRQPATSSAQEQPTRRKATLDSPTAKSFENPSTALATHNKSAPKPKPRITKEGWVNLIDSHFKKSSSLKDSWKLHYAMIIDGQMLLYKSPSTFQIRSFDITAAPPSPVRPASAPTVSSANPNVSSLRHKSSTRHPELILHDDGHVKAGSVEALCHELMFTTDPAYVKWATLSLSGWTGPETALSVLLELATLQNCSARIAEILEIIATATPGLLLETDCFNCARLLAEKSVGSHDQERAKAARLAIESARKRMRETLGIADGDGPPAPFADSLTGLSRSLSADEFLRIDCDIFASQVHLFHLKYFKAWSPANDISLLLASPHLPPPNHRNPLIFSTSSIHFLGDRVLNHVLTGEAASNLDHRVAVLTHWIKVAYLLKTKGDMAGYLAIMMAVLSPPILRLRETWSAMPATLVEELQDTGCKAMRILERRRLNGRPDVGDGRAFVPKGVGVDFPCSQGIPFFGDLLHCMDEAYAARDRTIDQVKMVDGLRSIETSLAKWKQDWKDVSPDVEANKDADCAEVEQIQNCLRFLNSNNSNPQSINSPVYFEKSLTCEPSWTGLYLQSHYHQKLPLSTGANVPLMFTDVRASYSLFDRSDTLAVSGSLHKKTPSSGLSSPITAPGAYPPGTLSNQSLRPPTSNSQQQQQLRRTRSFPPNPSAQTTGFDDLDFTTRQRTAVLHGGDNAMLRAIRDVAGVGQQLFHSKDGELVLKSMSDDSPSRPASVIETTSNRHSLASKRHSQIASATVSPRQSMVVDLVAPPGSPTEEAFYFDDTLSMLVVPKGGTLERLVDILVLGVEDFSKRMISSEQGLGENEEPPLLRMHMDIFTITFFATFRSYCSPIVLIDYLKKRLVGSKSAASYTSDESDDVVFPDWTGVDHIKSENIDWFLVAKIHLGILDAIEMWLNVFPLDFYSDQSLGEAFVTFIGVADKELRIWDDFPDTSEVKTHSQHIIDMWHRIKEKFAMLSYTPSTYAIPSQGRVNTILCVPHPNDLAQISEFIEVIDFRADEFFRAIKLVDWMFAFEILEMQSVEPMGFFVPKISLLTHEDEDAFQDIFFLLEKLKRGSTNITLLQALPKSIRDLCSFHVDLTNWILAQVVDPKINLEQRTQRISTLLRALSICQQRMSGMDLHDNTDSSKPRHIPSFIGNSIANALVRPESRQFSLAWQQGVKHANGVSLPCDTLEQVIPATVDFEVPARPLTTSVGWMIERLLEIVCHVPNMVVDNNRLINFDKRRYVYNFVNNFAGDSESRYDNTSTKIRYFSLKVTNSLDLRSLRDLANKENGSSRPRTKIFWKLVALEQEKLRRDSKQREHMERQQKTQMRAEHRRQPTAMRIDTEKKGGKRLGVNSIFKAVRPISMAFTSGWTPPQNVMRIVSPSELPSFKGVVDQGRKPVATIDLKSVNSVSCPRKTRDKAMWKISPGSGTGYLLQAISENELEEWLKVITSIRGIPISDGAESIDALTVATQHRQPQPVFGQSLEELCKRDKVKVPNVIEALLSEIEMRGMGEVGIYRVPGSLASINALKTALDSGEDVKMDDDRWYDINVIAGTFKSFMRELPHQVLEPPILQELRDLTATIPDENDRVPAYREVMLKLKPANYHFMRRVYLHFARIASNAAVNKMHAVNLAIVFGMGLSPSTTPFGVSPDLGLYQTMVKTWIAHAEHIFPDVEDDDETSGSLARTESATVPSEPNSPAIGAVAQEYGNAMPLNIDERRSAR